MSQEMTVFQNNDFGSIRALTIDGEPWFVGKDVAEALGYSNSRKAIKDHVEAEDKGVTKRYTPGGKQDLTIINESGLYSLILSSKLPTAKQFKHWVTSEILPSIRKHGAYMTPQTIDSIIADPDNFLKLVKALSDEQKRSAELENALTVAEANNLELRTANKALAIEVNTWDYRRVTVALIRAYGTAKYSGSSVAWAWCELYRRMEYKLGVSVKLRRAHSKTTTRALIDYIRKSEWPRVTQLAAAMCDEIDLNIGMIIGRENESRLRSESA